VNGVPRLGTIIHIFQYFVSVPNEISQTLWLRQITVSPSPRPARRRRREIKRLLVQFLRKFQFKFLIAGLLTACEVTRGQ
jgi:hypothetical protein